MKNHTHTSLLIGSTLLLFIACKNKNEIQYSELISSIDLKRGEIVSCSPEGAQFGEISFAASLSENLKPDFNTAVALLHSFEYDEAEKMFSKVLDKEPRLRMAWWGICMSNFHQLWAPQHMPN